MHRKSVTCLALLPAVALLAAAPSVLAKGGGGGTPFRVTVVADCLAGTLDWSATVAASTLQAVWVTVPDVGASVMTPAGQAGTYRGAIPADLSVSHPVMFRRLVTGKTEETVFVAATGVCG